MTQPEPVPLICLSDLLRLSYAYTKIPEKETRQALLEFAESCASERLELKESEHDGADDDAPDTPADK